MNKDAIFIHSLKNIFSSFTSSFFVRFFVVRQIKDLRCQYQVVLFNRRCNFKLNNIQFILLLIFLLLFFIIFSVKAVWKTSEVGWRCLFSFFSILFVLKRYVHFHSQMLMLKLNYGWMDRKKVHKYFKFHLTLNLEKLLQEIFQSFSIYLYLFFTLFSLSLTFSFFFYLLLSFNYCSHLFRFLQLTKIVCWISRQLFT